MAASPDNPSPADASGASIIPSDVSQLVLDPSTAGGELAAMHAKFLADFAGESIARHPRRPRPGPAPDER